MFFSNIAVSEKYHYMEEKIHLAYIWLAKTDVAGLPVGIYPIVSDKITANVQEYDTIPFAAGIYETHDKYFDIQYVVSGKEQIGVCRRDCLTEKERDEENDLILYEEPERSSIILLEEGDMLVVAPEDAHKPRCQVDGSCTVKKVVIKVSVS